MCNIFCGVLIIIAISTYIKRQGSNLAICIFDLIILSISYDYFCWIGSEMKNVNHCIRRYITLISAVGRGFYCFLKLLMNILIRLHTKKYIYKYIFITLIFIVFLHIIFFSYTPSTISHKIEIKNIGIFFSHRFQNIAHLFRSKTQFVMHNLWIM